MGFSPQWRNQGFLGFVRDSSMEFSIIFHLSILVCPLSISPTRHTSKIILLGNFSLGISWISFILRISFINHNVNESWIRWLRLWTFISHNIFLSLCLSFAKTEKEKKNYRSCWKFPFSQIFMFLNFLLSILRYDISDGKKSKSLHPQDLLRHCRKIYEIYRSRSSSHLVSPCSINGSTGWDNWKIHSKLVARLVGWDTISGSSRFFSVTR